MYKKTLWLMSAAFCLNVFLSVLPSCKRKGGSNGNANNCKTATCFSLRTASVNAYNGHTHMLLDSTFAVNSTDLVLNIRLEGTVGVCHRDAPQRQENTFSLFNTAYAYAAVPACLSIQGNDSIVAYNIYSSADYDLQHPAGTSLNDIITTDDIPSRPLYGTVLAADLMVDKAPAQSGNYHSFTIVLTKKNGQTVDITTPAIKML